MLLTESRRPRSAGGPFVHCQDWPDGNRFGVKAVGERFVGREEPDVPDSSRPGEREVDPETGAVPMPPGVVEPRVGPPIAPPIPPPDSLPEFEPGRGD